MAFERLDDTERKRLDHISTAVIGAAIRIHSVLGPGLLESAYEVCLAQELRIRGTTFSRNNLFQ
jgi:GxxExxY protein